LDHALTQVMFGGIDEADAALRKAERDGRHIEQMRK
jgi:hypothetical protein